MNTWNARNLLLPSCLLFAAGTAAAELPIPIADPACVEQALAAASLSAGALEQRNQVMAHFGPRHPASPAHEAFIDWLEHEASALPGITTSSIPYQIDRWLETGSGLTTSAPGGDPQESLPPAAAFPYSKATGPSGLTAPLVYVPPGTPLAEADVAGKIVVRDVVPGSLPQAAFLVNAYYVHDPALTFDYFGNYERGWLGGIPHADEESAAGAVGAIYILGFPRAQIAGTWVPYPGIHWDIPALYLGADEGETLKQRIAAGPVEGTITIEADRRLAPTRTLVATLPGQSPERIVVETHTDGVNPLWDNGTIALLALAESLSALPVSCRPKTFEFVFATGHTYGAIGANDYADRIDAAYARGEVSFVLVLEHFGAYEYEAVARANGPGRELRRTDRHELGGLFVSESPLLVETAVSKVIRHDVRRTWILRGADVASPSLPPHKSYGGEGGPFHQRLVPTVAFIVGTWNLFVPGTSLDGIDFEFFSTQAKTFADLLVTLAPAPREAVAGADAAYRELRAAGFE